MHQPKPSQNILSLPIASIFRWRACVQTVVGLCATTVAGERVVAGDAGVKVSGLQYEQAAKAKSPYFAYPAISVPTGAFSSSYAPPPPVPRSMPTSLSNSGWSSAVPNSGAAYTQQSAATETANTAATQAEPRGGNVVSTTSPAEESTASTPSGGASGSTSGSHQGRARGRAHAAETPAHHAESSSAESAEAPAPKKKPHFRVGTAAAPEREHVPHEPSATPLTADYTGGKEIIPEAPAPPPFRVSGSAGYYSRYMFRGLDVAYRTGIDAGNESGFFASNAAVSLGDFTLGFWYEHSLDSYVPGGAGFDKSFGNLKDPFQFKTPQKVRYQEYDLFANYTFRLTDELALTTGMNFYWFNDGRFWANGRAHVNSTTEAAASVNYTGIPYLNQTLSYFYDFDAFKGSYLEYKVAAKTIELVHDGDFAIGLIPSVTVSYDFRYNGSNNGWNHIEPGLDVPIKLSEGLTLNLGARYAKDLGSSSRGGNGQAVDRTDDRFWFSAAFQYTFPNCPSELPLTSKEIDGKSMMEKNVVPEHRRWEVAVGAGVRKIESSFDMDPAKPYDVDSLFRRKNGFGDLFFAADKKSANYIDGRVYSGYSSSYDDGTTDFVVRDKSQVTNLDGGQATNRQITYHSDRYLYTDHTDVDKAHSHDDDAVVYPYLSLSYEAFEGTQFGLNIGVSYAYNHSNMDSGERLVGQQSVTEQHSTHFFTYDIDEIFSTPGGIPTPLDTRKLNGNLADRRQYYLIYDGGKYEKTYKTPFYGPQRNEVDTRQRIVDLGVFRKSKLDVDLHTVSLPIDLKADITKNLHVRLSAGPTFNLFNEDLETETHYQALAPGDVNVTFDYRRRDIRGAPQTNGTFDAAGAKVAPAGGKAAGQSNSREVSSNANVPQQAQAGGGKGSQAGRSRKLPGQTVQHDVNSTSGQEFKPGVFGQASLEIDLDCQKRWFVELYARYDYVPSFTISDGITSSTIDASSFGGGIGLGFRF